MNENPYESPRTESLRVEQSPQYPRRSRGELQEQFKRQKWIILVYLVQMATLAAVDLVASPFLEPDLLWYVTSGLMFMGLLFCAVIIYRQARLLMGTGVATMLATLAFFPLVALIVMVIVDRKARDELRRHGIEVGMFGTDYEDI